MQDRPYQKTAISFLANNGKGILRGPTGAGKTYISLKAAMKIGWQRLIIVVPRYSALLAWQDELIKFGIEHTIIQKWSPTKRSEFWLEGAGELGSPGRVAIVLYQTVCKDIDILLDKKTLFDFIICDECHRIRERRTLSFKSITKLSRNKKRFFLSATLQSKGPQDLWAPLSIVSPGGFSSYYKFRDRYCVVENDGYKDEIIGIKSSTLEELKFKIAPYLYNIRKKDIKGFVPESVRKKLHVELSPNVKRIHDTLMKESMLVFPDRIVKAPGELAKYTAIRKLLTCPALIHDNLGVGDALEAVWDHAHGEKPKPHSVIFSDFKEQFPIWKRWLEKQGGDVTVLQGGMSSIETSIAIDQFSRLCEKKQSWLLCTIPFAESWNLFSPEDGYFIGWSWDQNRNWQAEGRLTRGTKTHANFSYCIHKNTIDEHMLGVLDTKVQNTKVVASDD